MTYREYAEKMYNEIFTREYTRILDKRKSESAKKDAERQAQHTAMLETFETAYEIYSDENNAADIWNSIYSAHLRRKVGAFDSSDLNETVIEGILSGAQSWKKCSGHVFEHFVVDYTRERLGKYKIRFLLQKELTFLIHQGKIKNDLSDGIEEMVKSEDFDVYAVVDVNGNLLVFGCIQVKTSIRDRVGRDVSFSGPAMERHFWAPAVVLDGAYLSMPKFNMMVNGGGTTKYKENGWHGMYSMANSETNDRIYADCNLDLLIEHAEEAAMKFTSARQRLVHYWRAVKKLEKERM